MNKKIILLTIIYVALMIRDDYALSEPTDNVKELESKAIQAANKHMNNRDDKSLEEQAYEAYSTLGEELRSLVDLMGEAEFQRILLLTTLPKDEQIKMIIQAMDKDSTNCS
uniref:Polymorphic mucin truncated splice variant C1/3.1/r1.1 n=1 Tax=Schistosoma mansoni TaxID=6183 RepID=B3V412_SCHMA|nr:polymorphic mucin truncated splice variant C1/3.1/r1.1 [Schistosoma mansoni]ACE88722.1 polymorphic mucin truncated splice variant C1/3.1/r1.2 [Schistosoma mansoni]